MMESVALQKRIASSCAALVASASTPAECAASTDTLLALLPVKALHGIPSTTWRQPALNSLFDASFSGGPERLASLGAAYSRVLLLELREKSGVAERAISRLCERASTQLESHSAVALKLIELAVT